MHHLLKSVRLMPLELPERGKTYHWPIYAATEDLRNVGLGVEIVELLANNAKLPYICTLRTGEVFLYNYDVTDNDPVSFSLVILITNKESSNKIIASFRRLFGEAPDVMYLRRSKFALCFWGKLFKPKTFAKEVRESIPSFL